MPELSFRVEDAEPVPYSAAPVLGLKLHIQNRFAEEEIRAIMLQCQIRIETTRRHYNRDEQKRLGDLFGTPDRWNQTLQSMLWTNGSVMVPPFRGSTAVDLPVSCTFDLTLATAKYFNGLEEGSVPLLLLFSGSVFYTASDDSLQVAQIPWSKETSFALPVTRWKEMMDTHYPNVAWLGVRRDVFDRLYQYKVDRGIATWEEALESILP